MEKLTKQELENKEKLKNDVIQYIGKYNNCAIKIIHEGKKNLYLMEYNKNEFQSTIFNLKSNTIIERYNFKKLEDLLKWIEEKFNVIVKLKNCVMIWGTIAD